MQTDTGLAYGLLIQSQGDAKGRPRLPHAQLPPAGRKLLIEMDLRSRIAKVKELSEELLVHSL